ncbi:MAG: hypothetical protein ABSG04_16835, partial [Verrucomicrobiota bacterium]
TRGNQANHDKMILWPESLAMRSQMHPKGDLVWMVDSVGETPTGATGTVALPRKSLMIGVLLPCK